MKTPPAFARLDEAAAAAAGFSSCAAAVAALEAAGAGVAPLSTRRGRVVLVDSAPVATNADGSAVCRHRDLSVCPACRTADPAYVDVVGATWHVPDPIERAELLALLAEVAAEGP